MSMKLEKVVPFGRSLDEYIKMFNLSDLDLRKRILGVGDGPASFNAEATKLGYQVTSIDPVYQFSGVEIFDRFNAVVDNIIEQVRTTPNDWVWSYHKSPDDLRQHRVEAIQQFLKDYDIGKAEKRYLRGESPDLQFLDQSFDLVLSSHFLFLYSEQLDQQFHLDAVLDMLRVGREVRIFPLLTLMLDRSPHLDRVIEELSNLGYKVSIEKVDYEFQKGGNEMLVIKQGDFHA